MSTFNDIDIECEECGEKFRGTLWVGVHAGQDPELKELLLGGELNLVSCPSCALVAFQEHFLLYQEPDADLVAYVYPESQKDTREQLEKAMFFSFHEAQKDLPAKARVDYDPILLFGLESLIELLEGEIEIAEQSQVAEAVCKQNQIKTYLLRPHRARQLETVRAIPRSGEQKVPSRDEVLTGIEQLLAINPALNLYEKLRDEIKANRNWSLGSTPGKVKV